MRKLIKTIAAIAAAAFISTSLAACSPATSNEITVVVHDSVSISKELLASFKKQTGIDVTLVKAGDTGSMTNKLVLTKDEPLGDAVYGIDNTFASLATKNGVVDGDLTAIDYGDVCMNYDKTWFSINEQAAPTSIQDLVKPEFDGLTVIENPTTSSVGLAFLTATVSVFGEDGWQSYWSALKDNNVNIVASWEDAYYTHFSGSSGKGKYPIVLSYSSSPAYVVRDYGDVCMNYDKTWFSINEQAAPTSIQDLVKPEFDGLTVIENPTTSSVGLAFLTATISVFGEDGWQSYWSALKDNNANIVASWEDAYYTHFSGSSGKGKYPIVLSYSSSPAYEVRDNGESQTEALLDACYRQTEYAAVLTNAKNKPGAAKFVTFLRSTEFQSTLAESMYVYPVIDGVKLPEAWAQFAPTTDTPIGGELDVNANREAWLKAWSALFAG